MARAVCGYGGNASPSSGAPEKNTIHRGAGPTDGASRQRRATSRTHATTASEWADDSTSTALLSLALGASRDRGSPSTTGAAPLTNARS